MSPNTKGILWLSLHSWLNKLFSKPAKKVINTCSGGIWSIVFFNLFPSFFEGNLILGEKHQTNQELNYRILHHVSHSYLRI